MIKLHTAILYNNVARPCVLLYNYLLFVIPTEYNTYHRVLDEYNYIITYFNMSKSKQNKKKTTNIIVITGIVHIPIN